MIPRRFSVNLKCASCKNKLLKYFEKYQDIEIISINVLEQLITINADQNKYNDEQIIAILKAAGFNGEAL